MINRPTLDATYLISSHDDPRTFQRFAQDILVFIRLPKVAGPTAADSGAALDERLYTLQAVPVRDISMTGLFFLSRLVYPSGSDLEVCLCLSGVEYLVPAVLKRRVRVNNQLCGYGVDFRQRRITRKLRLALATFLLRQAGRDEPHAQPSAGTG